ncbi:tape measure protein [Cytophagaceae bacterium YF14B1]|uniref:Tape measure protein n=1 Tax=Xanthocytophaga flava TaxID=3048013 RepID=A0AAE3U6F4_9BACT|nr:tape measure protein [Xanthocytophaga flavus]MDJ1481306.1 tape measure protein [Xanthocytophaga flavus]
MATIAELNIAIGLSLDKFDQGVDQLGKNLERLGDRLSGLGESFSKYLTVPLTLLGGASIKAAGDMEALEKGLVAVTGDAEKAAQELKALKEVARLPGLGLKEAVQGSINLQAAGFSAKQARESLQAFGNALAVVGKGKADLDGVTLALTQIASKGKISAEEINQIAERVPQFRKAIQAAFGTSNSEDLQKLGISAQEFVEKTTKELSKLPKASAGINASFENIGDTILQSLSRIGNAISKAFNLQENLPKLENFITGIVDAFESLSPVVQKVVVVLGTIAAAIGPVLLVIGKLVAVFPTLVAGAGTVSTAFTALSGPVGLVVAAIAAAVALIIDNWDSIVAYFTTGEGGKFLDGVKPYVKEITEALGVVIGYAVGLIKDLWSGFKTFIVPVISETFGAVLPILKDIFAVIANVFKAVSALLRGDWSALWESLLNIAKGAVNLLLDLIVRSITYLPDLIAGVIEKIDPSSTLAKKLRNTTQTVKDFVDQYKFTITSLSDSTKEEVDAVSEEYYRMREASDEALTQTANNTKALTDQMIKALEKVRLSLRQVEEENKAFGASYDYIGERAKALEKGISALIESGFNAQSSAVQKLIKELGMLGEAQKNALPATSPIAQPIQQRIQTPKPVIQQVQVTIESNVSAVAQELQELSASLTDGTLNAKQALENAANILKIDVGTLTAQFEASGLSLSEFFASIQVGTSTIVPEIQRFADSLNIGVVGAQGLIEASERLGISLESLSTSFQASGMQIGDFLNQLGERSVEVGKIIEQSMEQMAVFVGEQLGKLFTGDFNAGSFFQGIMDIVANFLSAFGKALIAAGIASERFKTLIENPYAAIAAGVALVALAGVAKSIGSRGLSGSSSSSGASTPSLSSGFSSGIDTKQTQQAVQKSVSVNAVSPTGSQQLDIHIIGTATVSGRDLVFVFEQEQKRNQKTGG